MSINTVVISGNLTRDSELGKSRDGTPVVSFRVAVTDRRRNAKTGQWETHPPVLVSCTAFGNRAVSLSRQLVKRTGVTVSGKLRYSRWETKGRFRSSLSILADEVKISTQPGLPAEKPHEGMAGNASSFVGGAIEDIEEAPTPEYEPELDDPEADADGTAEQPWHLGELDPIALA